MDAYSLTAAVRHLEDVRKIVSAVRLTGWRDGTPEDPDDGPRPSGWLGKVHVNRSGSLAGLEELIGALKGTRLERVNSMSLAELMSEWASYAEGCTAEGAPNPDEYVREFYPERFEDFFGQAERN